MIDDGDAVEEQSPFRIAARSGIGLDYVMEANVRDDHAAGSLVRVLEDWTPALASLTRYYSGWEDTPAVFRTFIQVARESLVAVGCA